MYPVTEQLDNTGLQQRVVGFLNNRGLPGADCLRVTVADGMVVIKGRLPSSQVRRLCLDCCRHVAGVVGVVDQTRIAQPAAVQDRERAPRPR